MKRLKDKFLSMFASNVFGIALKYAGIVSRYDMYQGEEPEELKKYRK